MITEDYVSYDIAKLLRDKGFDEQTVRCYNLRKELCICQCRGNETINSTPNYLIAAPTFQMALKWLREVHKIFINVSNEVSLTDDITYQFFVCTKEKSILHRGEDIKTFEDACNEAMKFALENLIVRARSPLPSGGGSSLKTNL